MKNSDIASWLMVVLFSLPFLSEASSPQPLQHSTEEVNASLAVSGHETLVWQGFYHEWTYNHRLNRLGDWIDSIQYHNNQLSASLQHAAASGSGSDQLAYSSFYSYLKTTEAQFAQLKVQTQISGREGSSATKKIIVRVDIPASLKTYRKAEAILHGFDLHTTDKNLLIFGNGNADKLIRFSLSSSEVSIENGQLVFTLDVLLSADCDSPECFGFNGAKNKWFDYTVNAGIQLIFHDEQSAVSYHQLHQQYDWAGKSKSGENEIFRDKYSLKQIPLQGKNGFAAGIPMIRHLDVLIPELQKGQQASTAKSLHMLALDMAVTQYRYNSSNGLLTLDADLFFKNWTQKMHPLAFGMEGCARLNLGICYMQFSNGDTEIQQENKQGNIIWKTSHLKQGSASLDKAVATQQVTF